MHKSHPPSSSVTLLLTGTLQTVTMIHVIFSINVNCYEQYGVSNSHLLLLSNTILLISYASGGLGAWTVQEISQLISSLFLTTHTCWHSSFNMKMASSAQKKWLSQKARHQCLPAARRQHSAAGIKIPEKAALREWEKPGRHIGLWLDLCSEPTHHTQTYTHRIAQQVSISCFYRSDSCQLHGQCLIACNKYCTEHESDEVLLHPKYQCVINKQNKKIKEEEETIPFVAWICGFMKTYKIPTASQRLPAFWY